MVNRFFKYPYVVVRLFAVKSFTKVAHILYKNRKQNKSKKHKG